MSDEPLIKFSVDGNGIGTLLLNRPHLFNAFNIEMADLWGDTMSRSPPSTAPPAARAGTWL